jgi:Carboxypeptidase regulatory-like domain
VALVSGTVRDQGGDPVEGARVYFASGPVPLADIAALTGPDGSFSLSAPAPGSYEVECAAEGESTQRATVEVTQAEDATLDFRLGRR